MAGTLIVSNLTTDTDNTFIVRSNTGTTLFSANTSGIDVANSIGATAITNDKILSVANTKISGLVTASQIANVANTQLTGTLIASQIASVNATTATSGTLPTARLPAGSVLQVVSTADSTQRSTSSGSFAASGMSVTITPTSATSKILIQFDTCIYKNTDNSGYLSIFRNGTNLAGSGNQMNMLTQFDRYIPCSIGYLDSPASTSALTYELYFYRTGSANIYINATNSGVTLGSITVMEIAG